MRVQHECRTGQDRRQFDLASISPIPVNRRWTKDQRSYVVEEDWMRDTLAGNRARDAASGTARLGAHRADMTLTDVESGTEALLTTTGSRSTARTLSPELAAGTAATVIASNPNNLRISASIA